MRISCFFLPGILWACWRLAAGRHLGQVGEVSSIQIGGYLVFDGGRFCTRLFLLLLFSFKPPRSLLLLPLLLLLQMFCSPKHSCTLFMPQMMLLFSPPCCTAADQWDAAEAPSGFHCGRRLARISLEDVRIAQQQMQRRRFIALVRVCACVRAPRCLPVQQEDRHTPGPSSLLRSDGPLYNLAHVPWLCGSPLGVCVWGGGGIVLNWHKENVHLCHNQDILEMKRRLC